MRLYWLLYLTSGVNFNNIPDSAGLIGMGGQVIVVSVMQAVAADQHNRAI